MENNLKVPTAQQIEKLKSEFAARQTESAIAKSKVEETEKKIKEEFGVSIEQVPQKLDELQEQINTAQEILSEEWGDFNEIWSATINSSTKSPVTSSPVAASGW